MSRLKLNYTPVETDEVETPYAHLDNLVPRYVEEKANLDALDKVCKELNNEIKAKFEEAGIDRYYAGEDTTLVKVVQHKESINEDKLLAVMREYNIPGAIVTVEKVNMDALENYLYNCKEIPAELATAIDSCRTTSEVVTLRITKRGKKNNVRTES